MLLEFCFLQISIIPRFFLLKILPTFHWGRHIQYQECKLLGAKGGSDRQRGQHQVFGIVTDTS